VPPGEIRSRPLKDTTGGDDNAELQQEMLGKITLLAAETIDAAGIIIDHSRRLIIPMEGADAGVSVRRLQSTSMHQEIPDANALDYRRR
jgi:hypothetical protein